MTAEELLVVDTPEFDELVRMISALGGAIARGGDDIVAVCARCGRETKRRCRTVHVARRDRVSGDALRRTK